MGGVLKLPNSRACNGSRRGDLVCQPPRWPCHGWKSDPDLREPQPRIRDKVMRHNAYILLLRVAPSETSCLGQLVSSCETSLSPLVPTQRRFTAYPTLLLQCASMAPSDPEITVVYLTIVIIALHLAPLGLLSNMQAIMLRFAQKCFAGPSLRSVRSSLKWRSVLSPPSCSFVCVLLPISVHISQDWIS